MKKLILAAMVALMLAASATDYKCFSECLDRGYDLKFCERICSY